MKTARELLTETRALIDKGWCQGTYAETATGGRTDPLNPEAEKFCIMGALMRANGENGSSDYYKACDAIRTVMPEACNTIPQFNDDPLTDKDAVLRVLDKAIVRAGVTE